MVRFGSATRSDRLLASAAAAVLAFAMTSSTASAVVPNDNTDSYDILVNETDVTGV